MSELWMERSGEMEVFARVVQEGSFSAAARALGQTPSSISKLVARLEARLGVRLLLRSTRVIRLTLEGQAYLEAAQRALRALNEAEQAVTAGVRGTLSVTSSVPVGTMFVAPALPSFLSAYPQVTVDFSVTDDMVNLLTQKADVAIRVGPLADSSLTAKKLSESPRVVVASPEYLKRKGIPATPAALEGHDCIRFNFWRPGRGWPFEQDGLSFEQPISGSLLVNNGQTAKQMALAGAGLARLGKFHVAEELRRGDLVEVLAAFNARDIEPINAVYVGGEHVPSRIRAFVQHMTRWMGEKMPSFVSGGSGAQVARHEGKRPNYK
ncbi:DNA-binding transcriptional LysR family regulator [Rhizomicrobium palustre]|uniref:DNA-binding transcriptional LysR family regulator n=1 Tax=Rhizomicrobium palustre TaxID=189966 RepID=A0A846N5I5_9PROT|nr:LysR family transcriptional regulator [Rhizomicrobium palustre]NIK90260.1 DNA-binding transcriptional LysR family regulator [Rhizomicrobium palustre]